jgi:hypothetical protein
MRHGPDNCLSAIVHRHVFHQNLLLSAGPVSLKRLDLRREGAGELIEGALHAVLLRNIVHTSESSRRANVIALAEPGRTASPALNETAAPEPAGTAPLGLRQAFLVFKNLRPYGITRFHHDQACWVAEMFLNEWEDLAVELGWRPRDIFVGLPGLLAGNRDRDSARSGSCRDGK